MYKISGLFGKKNGDWINIIDDKVENTKPPIDPEKVLFGLIEVNFGPLNNLPKTKPPISVDIHIKITNIRRLRWIERS